MYRVAVMGDKDSISGFAALGLETFPVADTAGAAELFRRIAKQDYAVLFITEALAAGLGDEIEKVRDRVTPAVILIPGVSGNTGMGMRNVGRTVEKAVGSDIIS